MQPKCHRLVQIPGPIFWLALLALVGLTHSLPSGADPNAPETSVHSQPDPQSLDPFGISDVSSLYGPGNWGVWFLTCVCATFSGSTISTVSCILYSATASVDLIIRCVRIRHHEDGTIVHRDLGEIAAAFRIVWMSVYCVSLVIVGREWRLYYSTRRIPNGQLFRAIRSFLWRNGYLVVGLLLMLLATGVCVRKPGLQEALSHVQPESGIDTSAGVLQTIVGVYFLSVYIAPTVVILAMLDGPTFGFGISVPGRVISIDGGMSRDFRISLSVKGTRYVILWRGIVMLYILPFLVVIGYMSVRFITATQRTHVLIPYTHYSLLELDQGFAMVVGVLGCIWEFGLV